MTAKVPKATKANPFPDECLRPSALLLEAHLAMTAAFRVHAVEPADLDSGLADLLVRLMKAPSNQLRGVDIGRQLVINAARTSRLTDRAERAGLVERRPDPEDRRAHLVTLTPAGRQKAESFAPSLLGVIERTVFATYTTKELQMLESLLSRLRDAAWEVAGDV